MNQSRSFSVRAALTASVAAIVGVALLAAAIPTLSEFYLKGAELTAEQYNTRYVTIMIFSYVGLLPVIIADIMLIKLLRLVKRGEVFTHRAVELLHILSLSCFIELLPVTALLLLMGRNGIMMIPLEFVGIFLGTVLCVVKNVIKCASDLKSENDLTV